MAVVSDDYHAVNAETVVSVSKPALHDVLYLVIEAAGCPAMTLWFETSDSRDEFYKKLVDAMGA